MNSDINILEYHEHYIKQTIRNRCKIATSNGILILTVPLHERKNNTPIRDIRISYKTDWQRQHIKSLETAYKSSPFFEFYSDELKFIYSQKPEYLIEWNQRIHQQISTWLKLQKTFVISETYQKIYADANDYRTEQWPELATTPYHQVFENKHGFIPDLSIFDLVFNCGNQAQLHLK